MHKVIKGKQQITSNLPTVSVQQKPEERIDWTWNFGHVAPCIQSGWDWSPCSPFLEEFPSCFLIMSTWWWKQPHNQKTAMTWQWPWQIVSTRAANPIRLYLLYSFINANLCQTWNSWTNIWIWKLRMWPNQLSLSELHPCKFSCKYSDAMSLPKRRKLPWARHGESAGARPRGCLSMENRNLTKESHLPWKPDFPGDLSCRIPRVRDPFPDIRPQQLKAYFSTTLGT